MMAISNSLWWNLPIFDGINIIVVQSSSHPQLGSPFRSRIWIAGSYSTTVSSPRSWAMDLQRAEKNHRSEGWKPIEHTLW